MSRYDLTAMANLVKDLTGLPVAIRIDQAPQNKKEPRVKVAKSVDDFSNGDNLSLSISRNPQILKQFVKLKNKDLREAIKWVQQNRSLLLKYWYRLEDDTHKVTKHLGKCKDYGLDFDTIMVTMAGMWVMGASLEEIKKRLEDRVPNITVGKIEYIMKVNRKFFPKRKK